MRLSSGVRLGLLGATAAALTGLGTDRAASQDVTKAPTFGSARLRAGFDPDPFTVPEGPRTRTAPVPPVEPIGPDTLAA